MIHIDQFVEVKYIILNYVRRSQADEDEARGIPPPSVNRHCIVKSTAFLLQRLRSGCELTNQKSCHTRRAASPCCQSCREVEDILHMLWVCLLYYAEKELLRLIVRRLGTFVTSLERFLFPPSSPSTVRFVYKALIFFLCCAGLDVCF